jgi:hypothetical protein
MGDRYGRHAVVIVEPQGHFIVHTVRFKAWMQQMTQRQITAPYGHHEPVHAEIMDL